VYAAAGDDDKALTLLLNLANATPHIVPLLCTQLVQLANKCQAQDRVLALLQFADNVAPSIDVTQAMSALQPQATTALFESHLNRQASLAAVAYVLADNNRTHTETTEALTKAMTSAITKAAAPLTRYRCAACGFEAKTYFWQCPGCQGWETFPARRVEEL
jgi:lipopolysaccharide biosynthesis regulator YciM